MKYSIGAGPVRVYGGHQKERRPRKPLTTGQLLGAFVAWLVLCIGGTAWIGIETQSAAVTIGSIIAILFVSFKILGSIGRTQ